MMFKKVVSLFINDIEFDYVSYDNVRHKQEGYFNLDCSFPCGGRKNEQWDQLYDEASKTAWANKELFLKLVVPHLNISGSFSIVQISIGKDDDYFVVSVRAKNPNIDETK